MPISIKRIALSVTLLCCLTAMHAPGAPAPSGASRTVTISSVANNLPAPGRAWVDSVMGTLDLRQRVAQLFVPRLDIADDAAGRRQLQQMVRAGVGGFLLGKGTIAGYASLVALAQSEARIPLMVTLDGEWGLAMRVAGTPRFPYNMALGAISDPVLLAEYGRETARECRALGINVDFAPVLDVNSNPANPVIGYRSFGEDPERVALLGAAYSQGMESGGVLSVAKHFPGHGDTSTDSHKTLPTVDHSASVLQSVDLAPFRTYINSGLSGIMVGHLRVPALDKSGTPASMSRPITTDLLRNKMKFHGLVFTDALAMKGADSRENNCVRALQAGADVLLGSGAPLADIDAVVHAVETGKISRADIDERCRRMLAYKWALGLSVAPRLGTPAQIEAEINSPEAEAVNRKLSAAAITVVKNNDDLLPIRGLEKRRIAVLSIGAPAQNEFSDFCRRYADCELYSADTQLSASTLAALRKADVVIVGVMSEKEAAQQIFAKLDGIPNVVPVFFMTPYRMSRFASSISHHGTLVAALDNTPLLREYAAQALFGGIAVSGRMPVNVKGVCRLGQGVDIKKSRLGYTSPQVMGMRQSLVPTIDAMVAGAIADGAFPGCQVLVAKDGNVVLEKAYGRTARAASGVPVSTSTLYDIASMTKATATLSGLMKAVDEGLMDVDAPLRRYLPELDTLATGAITLRQLLVHESGLPAGLNIYKLLMDTATYSGPLTSRKQQGVYTVKIEDGLYGNNEARFRRDLVSDKHSARFDTKVAEGVFVADCLLDTIMYRIGRLTPGPKQYKYSDLNFCLLMAAEESATEVAHDQWVETTVLGPIGAFNSMFRPADRLPLTQIAPTENDRYLRRQTVHGYVHDELAAFSGGIQGNAGLFSTAGDVAKLAQMWLNGGEYGGVKVLDKKTVDFFTRTKSSSGRRGLGFDRRSNPAAPQGLYGHTGFTGTCFWVDPVNNLVFVFLSNRVNPSRDNPAFSRSEIRQRLLQAVYDAL